MLGQQAQTGQQRRATIDRNRQLVLRLWHSGIVLGPDEHPLWVGNVTLQAQQQILFLQLPFTLQAYDTTLETLMVFPDSIERRVVNRSYESSDKEPLWQGNILLLRKE